jgi:nucleoside-diphosphate-sugar epimerase
MGYQMDMYTILGAGGTTANALQTELLRNNKKARLVCRRPIKTGGENISWVKADLLSYPETLAACKGASVIFLCAGLGVNTEDWKNWWPVITQNAIDVSKAVGSRLIFFDNTYMYGVVDGVMTESTPYNPCTIKGEIRAKIAEHLMDEVRAGNLSASIARAGGFYGTDSMMSVFDSLVLDKYSKRHWAQWLGNPDYYHNFTFIPDAGKALFLLSQHSESDNQIWHVPTAAPKKGKELIEIAAGIYGVKPSYLSIRRPVLKLMGLFSPKAAHVAEMYFHFDRDYNFNSSKFEKAFDVTPTSFSAGIKEMSDTNYKKQSFGGRF